MSAPNADSNGEPTVISLFAGCGGSSLGYQWAGFRELLAVEWDKDAAATFRLNFPDVPVYEGDIRELAGTQCMKLAGIKPDELDVLDASPPCQGFSTAGKRRLSDLRNSLGWEIVRLAREFRPRCFMIENVPGLVHGHMKGIYLTLMSDLRALGYAVRGAILNAMYFGVPQSRRRVIIIGSRNGLPKPTHPKPTIQPKSASAALRNKDILLQDKSILGTHSPRVIGAWHASGPGQSLHRARRYVGSFQSVRLDPDRPSRAQIAAHRNWRWDEPRQLTIAEMATLQGFPADFLWPVSVAAAQKLIGNSVPPPLMEAIARHIRQTILHRVTGSEDGWEAATPAIR